MSALTCHICNQDDTLQNLGRCEVGGEAVHAHKRCIDAHNKKVRGNNRKFDAMGLADYIFAHDIDATDNYEVERFLRERPPEKRDYLSGRRPSVDDITDAACEIREENRKKWLFKQIEQETKAWPAKPSEDLIARVVEDLAEILPVLTGDEWRNSGAIGQHQTARATALLLIEQVARRRRIRSRICRVGGERRGQGVRRMTDNRLFPPFPAGQFGVIYSDPPWRFMTYSAKGTGRSAVSHFDVLDIEALKTLPMTQLAAKDCVLLLWVVRTLTSRVIADLFDAWGFKEKSTAFIWAKITNDGSLTVDGTPFRIGNGFGTRAQTERCILATRGQPKRLNADVRELIFEMTNELIIAPRGQYAQKPAVVYERIEKLFNGPFLEMFGRVTRPNWESWGDQVGLLDKGPVKTRRQPSDLTRSVVVS